MSDQLLGRSPMAPIAPLTPTTNPDGSEKRFPTAQDVTTSGGVWAPTSAKRDKLAEFKTALTDEQDSLDDAATPEQLLDLYLADGMQLIANTTDTTSDSDTREIQSFSEWMVQQQTTQLPEFVDEMQLSAHLSVVAEKLEALLVQLPSAVCLRDVRDFMDPLQIDDTPLPELPQIHRNNENFEKAVLRLRLRIALAAVDHLKKSWDVLSLVSDQDVDRAAVKGENLEHQAKSISLAKVYKYLFANLSGGCSERVEAAWELLDRDDDGLLDEVEMNQVAFFCVVPIQTATTAMFEEALDAYPVRSTLTELSKGDSEGSSVDNSSGEEPKGWRERRKANKVKKLLMKTFLKTTRNHFVDEVEINHRLRCVYAWAVKEHQSNQLESVIVEEDGGWAGKKRDVELSPKISLSEFREIQQEHFTHLDRIGTEMFKSFREDMWVIQGKGRERSQLIRDSAAFLAVVSFVDYVILAL